MRYILLALTAILLTEIIIIWTISNNMCAGHIC